MLNVTSQKDKEKYLIVSFIAKSKKNHTHSNTIEWWLPGVREGGGNQERLTNEYKLLVIR